MGERECAAHLGEDVRLRLAAGLFQAAAPRRAVVSEEHELDAHGGARRPREELQRAVVAAVDHGRRLLWARHACEVVAEKCLYLSENGNTEL